LLLRSENAGRGYEIGACPGDVVDATIALQAFVLNIVGCIDNLAWVWVCEKPVSAKNGADLEPRAVGLWKKHTQVRDSLSSGFREFLETREPWFEHTRGFRDSLAHRIPLYIPPYGVRHSRLDEHARLDAGSLGNGSHAGS
jgi:hypothetical protein